MPNSKAIKYYEEGRSLQYQGKLSSAERAYRKAIKADQDFVEAYNNLGNVLVDRKRLQEAAGAYRKAVNLLPDHPMLLNNLGNALQLQGESEKALGWFEKAIARDANYIEAYVNLGSALRNTGRTEKALACYRQAVNIDPRHPGALLNLGILLIELEEPDAAVANLEKAVALNPDDPVGHYELGNALRERNEKSTALKSFSKAVELDPEYADAYVKTANLYKELGLWQEARENYRRAIALRPDLGAAYLGLSRLQNPDRDDDLLEAMERQNRKPGNCPRQLSHLRFALGNAYHERKQFDRAFEYYKQANQLRWSTDQYDLERDLAYFRELRQAFRPGFFDRAGQTESGRTTPIFIVGLPRSGKTLTEAMLARHPRICDAGERHGLRDTLRQLGDLQDPASLLEVILDLSGEQIERHARAYMSRMQPYCSGEPFVINTMPVNFYYVGFIRLLFPHAKVIHCCRQPLDACWFMYQRSFSNPIHNYSSDLDALASYYREYKQLIDHWHSVLPGFMLDIHYEQLISETENELSRLLSFVGLERQGISLDEYDNSPLHTHEIGEWRHYESHLEPLKAVLE